MSVTPESQTAKDEPDEILLAECGIRVVLVNINGVFLMERGQLKLAIGWSVSRESDLLSIAKKWVDLGETPE